MVGPTPKFVDTSQYPEAELEKTVGHTLESWIQLVEVGLRMYIYMQR